MQLVVRRPEIGYLDSSLWIPKTACQVEGIKRALNGEGEGLNIFQADDASRGAELLKLGMMSAEPVKEGLPSGECLGREDIAGQAGLACLVLIGGVRPP